MVKRFFVLSCLFVLLGCTLHATPARAEGCNPAGCAPSAMGVGCNDFLTAAAAACVFTMVSAQGSNVAQCAYTNFGNLVSVWAKRYAASTGVPAFCQVVAYGFAMTLSGTLPCSDTCYIDGAQEGLPVELLRFGVE